MKERSDDDLLDSLYGERADRLDQEVGAGAGEADDDLDQLRRLRGVFAELKASQEEPPPAGMALLMAAARQAAEERKPKQEGLWAKLRAGWAAMVAHPAMAAATAAVVVIGASGYLMSRGVKTAESTYSASDSSASRSFDEKSAEQDGNRSTSAPAPAAAPVAEPPPDPAAVAAPEAPAAKLEMATGAATGTAAPSDGDSNQRDRRQQLPAKKPKPMAAPREELGGLVEGGSAGGGEDKSNRLDDSYAKQNPGAISGSSSAGKARPTTSPPPPPPPPPAQAAPEPVQESEAADSDGADASKDETKKKSGVESITQQSERWYQLARDAAVKGDCNAVRLLAERVQSENPGFYEKRFKKDPSITKCL